MSPTGHSRHFERALTTSALTPVPDKLLQRANRSDGRYSPVFGGLLGLSETSVLWDDILLITEARGFKWRWKLRRCPLDWT